MLFSLLACEKAPPETQTSLSPEKQSELFFRLRRKNDLDRKDFLQKSQVFYSGEKVCSRQKSCIEICGELFLLEEDIKDCKNLPVPQVFQFQKIYSYFAEEKLNYLREINVFDLKVFLNLSAEPLYRVFKSLDSEFAKKLLVWTAYNWTMAQVFKEEDKDFLFLNILLKKIQNFPIDSLSEELNGGRTFLELSWLNQNDSALLWLNDYLQKFSCAEELGENKDNCVLNQYCHLSQSLKEDVAVEIMDFQSLREILNRKKISAGNLKEVCVSIL